MLGSMESVERLDPVAATQQGYSWSGGTVGVDTLAFWGLAANTEVPVGTLLVDLTDTKQNRVVWWGVIKITVDRDDVEGTLQRFEQALKKLFKKFPPR